MTKLNEINLVCCLDILGYKDLVENCKTVAERNKIPNLLQTIEKVLQNSKEKDNISDQTLNYTNIQIISDTIIVALDLKFLEDKPKEVEKHFDIFFKIISLYFVLFPVYIGYFLRGGVSIGKYYQSKIGKDEKNQFIFSKAFNEAHELAETADWPRIIVNNVAYDEINKRLSKIYQSWFFQDWDNSYCLNTYLFIKSRPLLRETYLKGIKSTVEKQISKTKVPKNLKKYYFLADYHNKSVKGYKNKKDYTIVFPPPSKHNP